MSLEVFQAAFDIALEMNGWQQSFSKVLGQDTEVLIFSTNPATLPPSQCCVRNSCVANLFGFQNQH